MKNLTQVQDRLHQLAKTLHWFTRDQMALYVNGNTERDSRIERLLPLLVKKQKLCSIRPGEEAINIVRDHPMWRDIDGNTKFYTIPERFTMHDVKVLIRHGIGCSESIIRLMRCDPSREVVSEEYLRSLRLGVIPDFAIYKKDYSVILAEFSTMSNIMWKSNITKKLKNYNARFETFKKIFGVDRLAVLFIFDIPGFTVETFIEDFKKEDDLAGPFVFCEFEDLCNASLGCAMDEAIYTFGEDGTKNPLRQ